jgi:hypothetical protein
MKKSPVKPKAIAKPAPKIDKSKEKKDKVKETKSTNKPAGRDDPAFKQAYRDWYMGKLAL